MSLETAVAAPTVSATATLCAEFPAAGSQPGDVEGWWSSTPANADGTVITDPARWPEPLMREHPRVALVDTATGTVISTWDRLTCGPDDSYEPPAGADWPAGAVAVVDMDTDEVISVVG